MNNRWADWDKVRLRLNRKTYLKFDRKYSLRPLGRSLYLGPNVQKNTGIQFMNWLLRIVAHERTRQKKTLKEAERRGAEQKVKRSWSKRNEFEQKIQFGSPPDPELPFIDSESLCPSLNSNLCFELVTPSTINKIFSELQVKGYQIQGLQESFMLSPLAAVQEKLHYYRPCESPCRALHFYFLV